MRKYNDPRDCHPCCCFSLARPDDKKYNLYKEQRRTRGFDDTELYNLDVTIIQFTLPRLKAFAEKTFGYPASLHTFEEWKEILAQIIRGFDAYLNDDYNSEDIKPAFENFGKYLPCIWF